MRIETRIENRAKWVLFLFGLGSATRVYVFGCLAFSEMVAFVLAPFFFINDFKSLKHDGFMPFVALHWAACFVMVGTSAFYYHVPTIITVKAVAVFYSIFSYLIVFHRYLKRNMRGIGWFLLGFAISSLIAMFYFNPKAQISAMGSQSLGMTEFESVVNSEFFWIEKVTTALTLPIQALYYQTPVWYVGLVPVIIAIVTVATSGSGRSATLIIVLMAFMVMGGRKSRRTMRGIGRHLVGFCIIGFSVVFVFYKVYQFAAEHGYLNEGATIKYQRQTKSGGGMFSLIVNGRIEPIVGIMGALDKPIIGFGALAIDDKDYYLRALEEFGDEEDVRQYKYLALQNGGRVTILQTHSHIVAGWVQSGIVGLVYWLYILWLMYDFVRRRSAAIPQWFGYFAASISYYAWHIFFSPIGDRRASIALFVTALLIARAVSKGKIALPYNMEMEARRYD